MSNRTSPINNVKLKRIRMKWLAKSDVVTSHRTIYTINISLHWSQSIPFDWANVQCVHVKVQIEREKLVSWMTLNSFGVEQSLLLLFHMWIQFLAREIRTCAICEKLRLLCMGVWLWPNSVNSFIYSKSNVRIARLLLFGSRESTYRQSHTHTHRLVYATFCCTAFKCIV